MSETNPIPANISRTLHDRIFKEFVHRFLPEFMQLFLPEVYLPQEIIDTSGEGTMEALNEIELMWHEKIELESQKKILLHQLELKFGRLSTEFISQIESIKDPSILTLLIDQVLFADSLEEITIPVKEIDKS